MIKGELAERMERLRAERVPFVTATVIRAMSPTSVRPGDSALVRADGTIDGFVGGVCAQASVRLHAARALETGDAIVLRLVPGAPEQRVEDGVIVEHNPCLSGGTLDIFLEPQLPVLRILVAGDTPIAHALRDIASAAGYDVVGSDLGPSESDGAVVVASHGEAEEELLTKALEAGVSYVALVASEKRGAAVRASLDVPDALREQLHTPAGLAIGARTPQEIAIAILAELVSKHVPHPASVGAPVETAIDPICGMTVTVGDASIHADIGRERFYFCSDGCRAAYIERSVTS
jgi:xanthine dehydrogenase accessory factor